MPSLDQIGDAVVSQYSSASESQAASSTEPARSAPEQSSPTQAEPSNGPTPQWLEYEFGGQKYAGPDSFKSPQDWENFVNQHQKAAADGLWRVQDYTRKSQENAELRRNLEHGTGIYQNLFKELLNKQTCIPTLRSILEKAGVEIPQGYLEQLEQQMRISPEMAEIRDMRTQIQRQQLEAQTVQEEGALRSEWSSIQQKHPELSAHPSNYNKWLFNQLYLQMDGEAAANAVLDDMRGMLTWDVIEKVPWAKQALEPEYRKRYLGQKLQDQNVRPISGGGIPITPATAPGSITAEDRKMMRGDISKYGEYVANKLKGQTGI